MPPTTFEPAILERKKRKERKGKGVKTPMAIEYLKSIPAQTQSTFLPYAYFSV